MVWLAIFLVGYDFFNQLVPTYDFLLITGVFIMLYYVINRLEKKDGYTREQTNKILIFLIISLVLALGSSYLVDGIFHSIKEGELAFGSINFLGGLIGGFAVFYILMKYYYKFPNKNMWHISNTIITGVVLAHAIGRIGCFFAGCCFGIPTESFLGVVFPHGHAHSLYPDTSVFPTQLFEAAFLFIMFILFNKVKWFQNKELEAYLIGYGVWRIAIEFIRGDDRGVLLALFETQYNVFPTPAQLLSVIMVFVGVGVLIYKKRTQETQ